MFPAALAQLDCDFEEGNICEWTQVPLGQDELDWNVLKGATSSHGTGPSNDHTTGSMQLHCIMLQFTSSLKTETFKVKILY